MSEKMYMYLLIFCGILCQGIIATLSDENTGKSSDFLVRKRRVINHLPGGLVPVRITDVNYVVNIKAGSRSYCAGVILSRHTVITAASCVTEFDIAHYKIHAGTASGQSKRVYNIVSKILNYGHDEPHAFDGIALLTIDPPFDFTRKLSNIPLFTGGPLAAGIRVTVFGFGCQYPPQPPPLSTRRGLRSITLPILNQTECHNIYRNHHSRQNIENAFVVKDSHICTYDAHQHCARTDAGSPLVVNGRLAGIHIWKGEFVGETNPDVYIDLQNPNYRTWVRSNIR